MLRSFVSQLWPPAPKFTGADVPAQTGRVFVVTGGNVGIGYELCRELYSAGGTVYMASRNKDKAEAAIENIVSGKDWGGAAPRTTGGAVKFLHVDLADMPTVREAARRFAEQETRLDVLWLNAGIGGRSVPPGTKSKQGLDAHMATHCVSHLLLAQLLRPQLERASSSLPSSASSASAPSPSSSTPARVVWAGSAIMEQYTPTGGIDFSALGPRGDEETDGATHTQSTNTVRNYAVSKAGNLFLAYEMARRWGSSRILSVCQNPGYLRTATMDGTPGPIRYLLELLMYPPRYGAYTQLFTGFSPDVTMEDNGCYILPWGRVVKDLDKELGHRSDIWKGMRSEDEGGQGGAKRLWEWCESHFSKDSNPPQK